MTLRDLPPSHYSLKVESFSLRAKSEEEKLESGVFLAGGYQWRLILYPNGNKEANGEDHISLYLAIQDTSSLDDSWEVNVEFKLFVMDQLQKKYLTIQDTSVPIKRFNEMKKEWGFAKLLPLKTFNDEKNGYLVDDSCIFGAEVFIIQPAAKSECFSMIEKPDNGSLTWRMKKFSTLNQNSYYSDKYITVGDRKWKITVYPKGFDTGKGNSLSVFLRLYDYNSLPPKGTVYANCKLRVLDKRHDKHVEKQFSHWFSASSIEFGYRKFMPLEDLEDDSKKGFVINDILNVEAEILEASVVKYS